MSIRDLESAAVRAPLRWYQFSLSGLLLLTLFVPALLSILGVGRSLVHYEALIGVLRQFPAPHLIPHPAVGYFQDAVLDLDWEQATSDSMMESVAQMLQQEGIETIDGQNALGSAVRKHVSLERDGNSFFVRITARSNGPKLSKVIACAFFKTSSGMVPTLTAEAKRRYIVKARSEFSASELQTFESIWQDLESRPIGRSISRNPERTWTFIMQNLKVSCSFVDDSDMPFEFDNGARVCSKTSERRLGCPAQMLENRGGKPGRATSDYLDTL